MAPELEADYAMTLVPGEGDDIHEGDDRYWHWNGWKKHHWPADIIGPGLKLYGFDTRPNRRRLCVLLEIRRGESFRYRTREEFQRRAEELTGCRLNPNDSRWEELPESDGDRPCTGIAFRWRVVKRVQIPLDIRFPRLGWCRRKGLEEGLLES